MNAKRKTAVDFPKDPSRAVLERRGETRRPAEGQVVLRFADGKTVIRGELIDMSASGFRMRYRGEAIMAGSDVRVSYPWGEVNASVVWVWSEDGWNEAGFLMKR